MPISQLTVLALYGEMFNLVSKVEMTAELLSRYAVTTRSEALREALEKQAAGLRADCKEAQRHAIETILEDAPSISINPLTGEAS
jgi:hypothetical protein